MKRTLLFIAAMAGFSLILEAQSTLKFLYQDTNLPLEERVSLLVSELTLEEKISQMVYAAPAIDRLGVPAHNWWNECLHGVARAGYATVFPQSITIAGSWDKDLMHRVATVISDEARAKQSELHHFCLYRAETSANDRGMSTTEGIREGDQYRVTRR